MKCGSWFRVCFLVLGVSNAALAGPFSQERYCSDSEREPARSPGVFDHTIVQPGTVREFAQGQLYLILVDPLVEFIHRRVDPKNPLSPQTTEMHVERGIAVPILKRCYGIKRDFIGQTLQYLNLETPLGSVRFDLYSELITPPGNGPKGIRLEDRSKLKWRSWAHGMELVEVHPETRLVQDPDFQKSMDKDFFTIWTSERETYYVSPRFEGKL
jgi:hypothetical protein